MQNIMHLIFDKIRNVFTANSVKNSIWIIAEQVFQMVLSLVVGMLSARYLGPSNFGTLNYTASFVSFFVNIASLCMEGVVVKKLVDYPEREGEFLGSCIFFRILSSILSMISIAIIIIVLNPNDTLKLMLAGLQSLQLFFKSFHILDSWFQRHLLSKYTSIGKMIASFSVSSYKLILLITSKSIIWFAVSNSISDLIIAVFLFYFYKCQKYQKLSIKIKSGKEVLRESYHFIIFYLMSVMYLNVDKVMIGKMLGDADVGIYIAASTVACIWAFVPMAISNSLRPIILELKTKDEFLYRRRYTQLCSVVIWTCIFFATLVFILSPILIRLLYGSDYVGSVNALKILTWSQVFAIVSVIRGIWILCEEKNKYVKYYIALGMITNILVNIILIPILGIEGAAIATLFTTIVVLIIGPIIIKETRGQLKYLIDGLFFLWIIER